MKNKTKVKEKKENNKKLYNINATILALMVYLILLNVTVFFVNRHIFVVSCIVNLSILGIYLIVTNKYRNITNCVIHGKNNKVKNVNDHLASLEMPVVIVQGKTIVWNNKSFQNEFLKEGDALLDSIYKLFPDYKLENTIKKQGQDLTLNNKQYTVYGTNKDLPQNTTVLYFAENTKLKQIVKEYDLSRPVVFYLMLDAYEELQQNYKESERFSFLSEIDKILEKYFARTTGFLVKIKNNKYMAVIEERHAKIFIKERFEVLDKIRQLGEGNAVTTLSIGVGMGGKDFETNEHLASSAIEMCMGRGGDQVAVKTKDGYTFFGGSSRGVEKRSKVKARIITTAISEAIEVCDNVIIMGHQMSDMDSVGAAIGINAICKMLNKSSKIVINEKSSLATSILDKLKKNGLGDTLIIPEEALYTITDKTLLIVVDVHVPQLLESPEIYNRINNVVVIDHHRKVVDYIENSIVFYHEPYASSASEMISEMLQYVSSKDVKLLPIEAEALLAGIVLDTRNFTVNTGVRTFEAAGYLRRMGAKPIDTQKLFADSLEVYKIKSKIVANSQVHRRCALSAIANLPSAMRVVIPQAANDLLSIENIDASFVLSLQDTQVVISARSLGEVNVQLIMEKLGGGGHLTMAGAQITDKSLEEVIELIKNELDEYFANREKD